jgi:hypothetical protein
MTQEAKTALTPEVKAMIGMEGEVVECWGTVDEEYLRRFTQALMDPDPHYWDEEFTKNTRYGETITPPIMVSYMPNRLHPREEDPVVSAFRGNPQSDGIGDVSRPGELPRVPTDLVRILNAGNEIELYKYPSIWDKVYYQHNYSDITERLGRDGNPFLIVTIQTRFHNQRGELLCITRYSSIRR